MAINYPGISYLKGYDNPDVFGRLKEGYAFGKGIKDEAGAVNALDAYVNSLYGGGAPQAARPSPLAPGLVQGSHGAAEAATDPMLSAYFANTRRSESGGNDAARNPKSSATGRYQFLEGTWNDLAQRHPQLGLTPDGRNDPGQQERAMKVFTAENAKALQGSGVPVNPGTLYAAHFLGAGAAPKVLTGDPNSPVSAYVDPAVVQANPQLADMTVAEFQQWAASKGGNGQGGYQAPMVDQPATGAPSGLPPKEVLQKLFANPVTRPLGVELIKAAQAGGGADAPSSVREWEYYNTLPDDAAKAEYLRMKRASPYLDIGTGFVQPDPVNPGSTAGPEIAKDNFTPAYDAASGTATAKVDVENQTAFDSLSSKLPGLKTVVSELSTLAEQATYTQTGQLWDNIVRETGQMPPEGAIARTKYIAMVDNQVLPLLRDTFGAAFTVKEGETLRATLGDPNKSPPEKQVILEAFIEQKVRDLEALGSRRQGAPAEATSTDDPLGIR
jgi:hypothetical protein